MTPPEFSRPLRVSDIGHVAMSHRIEANAAERAALAERFGLVSLEALAADLSVRREAAGVRVTGRVIGSAEQPCAVSGAPVPAVIDEPVDLLFSVEAEPARPDEEIELREADLDIVPFSGDAVDVGEAVAQSFGLALNPYPRAPDEALGEVRRKLLSEEEAAQRETDAKTARNPFAVLKREQQ